ncbi:MAG: putative toxin-antitoxin system toxin component, PIN family [Nitrospirae bacterium]|nr:putative toxin-antitoxin system toxin component, PIN family [Nitrospirota bacterium]
MKVVIDTNVLVSAVLKDKEPETVLLFVVMKPDVEWIVSPQIVSEYKEVLSRDKFAIPEEIRNAWFGIIDALTTVVNINVTVEFPRDQKDAKFLECAAVSGANYFVTGDSDFMEARKLLDTTILFVSQFKKLVCDVLS